MADFHIVLGDRLPKIKGDPLRNPDGTACNLTGATVTFQWAADGATPGTPSSGSCTVLDATNGVVEFQLPVGAFAAAGIYHGRFVANWSGVTMSFPNKGSLTLEVESVL